MTDDITAAEIDADFNRTMEIMRDDMETHFPTIEYSIADCAWYWKSLEEHQPGEELRDGDRCFIVQWSDAWWKPGDIIVYIARLEPKND